MVTLRKKDMEATCLVGSDMVIVDNKKIFMDNPIRRLRGSIIVPFDFKDKVIEPLIKSTYTHKKRDFKIIIDAGHGGRDPGAIGVTGVYEKDVTLDIAKRLKVNLLAKGFLVGMTRDRDEFISLEKRTELTAQEKGDLFVSIHANASPAKRAKGIEIFFCRPLEKKDMQEKQRQKNHFILFKKLDMEKGHMALQNTIADLLYDYKRKESPKVASYVINRAADKMQMTNRGEKTSGFFVLRNTLIPAILVEVGFLSNSREEKLLKQGYYRDNIAHSLAEGILDYYTFTQRYRKKEVFSY